MMRKRLPSLFIALMLSVAYLTLPSGADTGLDASATADSVITEELLSVMASVSSTEKIPVNIWTTEIDADVVEEIALQKTGLNRDQIREMVANSEGDLLTSEAIDEYIAAEREIYKRLQTQAHQAFIAEYAFLQTASTAESAFISEFAPMIIVELTKTQIQTLSEDSSVEVMFFSPEIEDQIEMNVSVPLIRADYTRDTSGYAYTGEGVKIGMIEYNGVPELSNLPENQIIIYSSWRGHVSEHATAVAEIMLSDGLYEGIAPDAQLYCTAYTSINTNFYTAAEWLLDNGVNVINMSAGNTANVGQYTQSEKWVDHIAINHSVHFVKSAGNTGEIDAQGNIVESGKVTHPGLAYNAITVGNLDDKNTSAITDIQELRGTSGFLEIVNADGLLPANKPDLVAPGTSIRTSSFPNAVFSNNTSVTGTSFAAPHVTGIIAQLMDQYSALKVMQDTMKAILTASVRHSVRQYASNHIGFEQYGAGLVDAKSSSNTVKLGNFISSNFSAGTANTYKSYTFTVTSADTIKRVALTWLKYNRYSDEGSSSTSTMPDTVAPLPELDLAIIKPDGTELPFNAYANSFDENNLTIIQFDPATYGYGTYTIQVWIRDATTARTYFSVSWW